MTDNEISILPIEPIVFSVDYERLIQELKKRCELPSDVEKALRDLDKEQKKD